MTQILIQNGRVIDPSQGIDRVMNLLIEGGKIAAYDVAANGQSAGQATPLDASGKIVSPGLIDLHAELREPGCEEDETIEAGTAAALVGGFTTIACLPNTDPPLDTQASVEYVQHQAARADNCRVVVIACVSKNREGKELAEIGSLVEAGAVAFSDAAAPIHSAELMRRALEYCLMFDKPILNHPETLDLTRGGIMHEGMTSMILGLSGIPAVAEDVMTSRDVHLAEATGGRIHIMNMSTASSIDILRRAKLRGVRVTAEVCPHHFTLTDESLRSFDSRFKVNPPLRSREHVEGCLAGLRDDTIDVIASGHSPRAEEKKTREIDQAPYGMAALETVLPLVITRLIEPGVLTWPQALAKLTINPARILGLDRGTLRIGATADVTIIDPKIRWTVESERFRSKSHSTPLDDWELTGRADTVIVGGKVKYRAR